MHCYYVYDALMITGEICGPQALGQKSRLGRGEGGYDHTCIGQLLLYWVIAVCHQLAILT